jgi:hypothetical protein
MVSPELLADLLQISIPVFFFLSVMMLIGIARLGERRSDESPEATDSEPIRIDEETALGIVVDGEPHAIYGTSGESASIDREQLPEDSTTVQFETGTRTLTFLDRDDETEFISRIFLDVRDPAAAWWAAPNPTKPVRSLVNAAGTELTASGQTIGELPVEALDRELSDAGIAILATGTERRRKQTYEIETTPECWYRVTVAIDEAKRSNTTVMDESVLSALRDGLAAIDDEQQDLDAGILSEHVDEPAVDIELISECDAPGQRTEEREFE